MLRTIKNEIKMMFVGGRLNRKRYIAYHGFANTCIGLRLFFLALLMSSYRDSNIIGHIIGLLSYIPISAIYAALMCWWLTRRINDIGKSTKWLWKLMLIGLVFIFIPTIVGIIIPGTIQIENAHIKLIIALMYVLGMFPFFIFGFMSIFALFAKGNPDANLFGSPPPKNNFFVSIFFILCIIFFIGNITFIVLGATGKVVSFPFLMQHLSGKSSISLF